GGGEHEREHHEASIRTATDLQVSFVKPELSVVIPFDASSRTAAAFFAQALADRPGVQVVLAGDGDPGVAPRRNVVVVTDRPNRGDALRTAVEWAEADVTVLQDADDAYSLDALPRLTVPIRDGHADVVVGRREGRPVSERALGRLAAWVSDTHISD